MDKLKGKEPKVIIEDMNKSKPLSGKKIGPPPGSPQLHSPLKKR